MPGHQPLTALLLLAALVLSGCSGSDQPAPGPVSVTPPPVDAAGAAVCARLAPLLPQTLGGKLGRRAVTADPTRVAAWGDPAVVLTCGVPAAGPAGQNGEPFVLGPPNDDRLLGFEQDDLGAATLFTSRGTAVTVSVLVPDGDDATVIQRFLVPLLDTLPKAPAPG